MTPERCEKVKTEWQRAFNGIEKADGKWVFWSKPKTMFDSVWTNQEALITGPAREEFISYYTDIFSKLKQLTPMLDVLFLSPAAMPEPESGACVP